MEKSSDAFRTISEVADDLDLPQHVLRFWETRFPHIKPMKRAGGRRYYRPADVTLLRTIRQLLYEDGYTIKGVQRLLKEQGPRGLASGAAQGPSIMANMDLAKTDLAETDTAKLDPSVLTETPDESEGATEASRLLAEDRDALLDTLSIVDECARILDALRRPAS